MMMMMMMMMMMISCRSYKQKGEHDEANVNRSGDGKQWIGKQNPAV
jgi:hypothetical protein